MDSKKTILLIDDEVDLVEALGYQLKAKTGHEVVIAYNGAEGLEKLKTIEPDLIILDMNMPVMGGIEFYHKICDENGKPKYPVQVLTARANLEQLFNDLDVVGFMTKPFDLEVLLNDIKIIVADKDDVSEEAQKVTERAKVVLFIEDDDEAFKQIAVEFLSAGYMVNAAKNGGLALEKIMYDIPDMILIKMGLTDLSGDLVAAKFKKMPKTANIPMVIYTHESDQLNHAVVGRLCEKFGFIKLIETDDPHELLKEAKLALGGK
jgi:DNA-binding response OmpR family regulator